MPVNYTIRENNLVDAPDVFGAHVIATASSGTAAIVDRMVSQGSTVTRADCLAVLENAVVAIQSLLLEGQRVNFQGLVELYPCIRGKFDSPTDSFDPRRHSVDVAAQPGSRVRKAFRAHARTEKIVVPRPAAILLQYRDSASGEVDSVATRSGLARVCGGRLSYDPEREDEGLFFAPVDGGEALRVAGNCVNLIKPGALSFANPAELEPGMRYRLEVRNRPRNVIELRCGWLEHFVTAA